MSATSSPNTEDNALVEFGPPRTLDVDGARAGRAAVAAPRAADGSLGTSGPGHGAGRGPGHPGLSGPPAAETPLTGGR